MYTQCVALLALYVGLAHCFSWDIVMGRTNGLNFYDNGTLTHSEDIASTDITGLIYDPVHNRLLFQNLSNTNVIILSSFDIATKQIQTLMSCEFPYFNFAYDLPSETIFWVVNEQIYSTSLKPGSNNAVCGTPFINFDVGPSSIAVDSCGGYVYWSTSSNIGRARFDGSEREVVINDTVWNRPYLAIDHQTQKMYWIEKRLNNYVFYISIESADMDGTNRKTLYRERITSYSEYITLSKDFIYWTWGSRKTYFQLPKTPRSDSTEPKLFAREDTGSCYYCSSLATNYRVEDQTKGSQPCEALKSLLPSVSSKSLKDTNLLCVHGRQVIGESVCNCTQGYTGDRCDVSLCQNYCLHGDCSVSDEQPKCRCNAGYFGERCELNACQGYCLNDGVCSLNADSEPVCHCTGDYEGDRCEVSVSVFFIKCFRIAPTLSTLRDILDTDVAPVTLDKEVLQLMSESSGACSLNEP